MHKLIKYKKFKVRMVSVKRLDLDIATRKINKISMVPSRNFKTYPCIFYVIIKSLCRRSVHIININNIKVENVFVSDLKSNIQNFLILIYFACHIPQFKMLIVAF